MTIEQTVEIPANHRIFFDLPFEIPIGTANVALTVTTKQKTVPASESDIKERTLLAESLFGILPPVVTLEEVRSEKLKRYADKSTLACEARTGTRPPA
ncbi:MAG: hypothetical protein Ta2A_18430 [Treponemataceae bacterium]|nr:MAG: hypothetical protein Ta2A_18430 [Treponemataceae bacterium]